MKKILCIGDLALDVISQLKEPINYGNDTASKISSHPGGQAANVATWITRTNSKAHLVARTGNDPVGFALISDLDKYGVEHLNLMHSGRPTGVVVILVDVLLKSYFKLFFSQIMPTDTNSCWATTTTALGIYFCQSISWINYHKVPFNCLKLLQLNSSQQQYDQCHEVVPLYSLLSLMFRNVP